MVCNKTDSKSNSLFRVLRSIVDTDIINALTSEDIDFEDVFRSSKNSEVFSMQSNLLFEGTDNFIKTSKAGNELSSVFIKMMNNSKSIDEVCFVNTGFDSSADRVTKSNLKKAYKDGESNISNKDGIFIITEEEKNQINPEIDLLYKCYKSSDIQKFSSDDWQNLYVIWTNKDTKINMFPNIKNHLSKFRKILEYKATEHGESLPWFSHHRARELDVFLNKEKIVLPYRSKTNVFAYSQEAYFGSKDILFLRNKDINFEMKYLLVLLNSRLYYTWLYYKGKRKGETLEMYVTPIKAIPIKVSSKIIQQKFVLLADKIIDGKKNEEDTTELEHKVDVMGYKLYELTYEEVLIVDKEFAMSEVEYNNFEL